VREKRQDDIRQAGAQGGAAKRVGMPKPSELVSLSATEAVLRLRKGEVAPREMVEASIARIEAVDGAINALPVRMFEQALEAAAAFKSDCEAAGEPGWLGGLPVAIKEYNDVGGQPTTFGSPIFANAIARESDLVVRNLETSGAIVIAKSNVPEFAGSNTFNPVYGATRNPWDLRMTAGGSSGGAAAALASHQVWLANGSDLGGSLRIPASYCGITGMRPSVGRVPRPASLPAFDSLWVEGPMARTVADLALMLQAQTRPSIHDALALPAPAVPFTQAIARATAPRRVGFTPDLGLARVVDGEVIAICSAAAQRLAGVGSVVEEACPDLSGSIETFQTLRALLFASVRGELLDEHRDRIAPEIVWNLQKGIDLTAGEIIEAERLRARIFIAVVEFFDEFDILACPTVALPPFPVEQRYPTEIGGEKLTTYIDWMFLTFCLTITGCPVISLPCGLTQSGLPVGLQLMGKPRGEYELLSAAHVLEQLCDLKHPDD